MEDIELGRHDDIYSRFLIVPRRSDRDGNRPLPRLRWVVSVVFFDRNFRVMILNWDAGTASVFSERISQIPVSAIEENEVFRENGQRLVSGVLDSERWWPGKPVDFVPIIPDLDVIGWMKKPVAPKRLQRWPSFLPKI